MKWKCWYNRGGFEESIGEETEERPGMAGERNLRGHFVCCHWVSRMNCFPQQKISISCWHIIELNLFVEEIHSFIQQIFIESLHPPGSVLGAEDKVVNKNTPHTEQLG